MASSNGPVSAAMLTDPRAMKRHFDGTLTSHFIPLGSGTRHNSEPLPSTFSSPLDSLISDSSPPQAKDDAYNPSPAQGKNPVSPPTQFDPRHMLDPKGFAKSRPRSVASHPSQLAATMTPSSSNGSRSPKRNREEFENDGGGMGSLIERIHGVSQRQEPPVKMQKFEDETLPETNKAAFRGGKGGELGAYVKEKRQEALAEGGSDLSSIVDLTGGDDEDLVFVSNSQDKEVCYGRIDNTKVLAHQVPCPSGKAVFLSKTDWPAMKLQLKRLPGKDNIIRVIDPSGKDFGNIDIRTALGLARIMDSKNPKFRTQAKLPLRKKREGEYPGKEISEFFNMTINLYGPKSKAETIGKWLSQRQIFLRAPITSDANIEIHNPHQPATAPPRAVNSAPHTAVPKSGGGYVSRTVEEIRSDVIGMFDSLQKSENLPELDADPKVTTELLSHQKQGLHFLTNKEKARVFSENEEDNNSLWRLKFKANGQRTYYNVITGHEERTKPPEMLGGILADMMGLGKTLSMLALIVGSLQEAKAWGELPCPVLDGEKPLLRNSRTTLLVAPLSTMANWEEQINQHIKPGTLKYYIYHGSSRISNINELAKYDMVITTYSIVSNDAGGRGSNRKRESSPLLQTNFFRIVLDEAHVIREQATRQSQAICALSAQRRWAVTGTPVQNRLDDLGALIKFLRIKPFSDKGGFAQFILSPCKTADPEILPKLRLLVDSFTLRRLKDRIDLPTRHDSIIRLEFNADERRLYDWITQDSQNKVRIIASDQRKSLGGKSYAHILRAILRLRLVCAHGRELLSDGDLKVIEGFSLDNAIDLEADEDLESKRSLSPRQAYEMLMLLKETGSDTCVQCTRTVEARENDDSANGDEVIGCMLPCFQILCRDCMDGAKASIQQNSVNNRFKCPFCEISNWLSFFELTKEGMEEAEEARDLARQNPRQAKIMGRYGGPHTKVKALIESLQQSVKESQSLPTGERPIKSVVFSGWTSNLDLIQIALEDNSINFVRLDGKMSRKARNASLDAFQNDPSVTVILVSIGAGGLGLNLTSGSKVYVMEPQFNPAAEAQAVDRIHRLGQTREVFTYRFIMRDSFEEKMLDLQRKKENLADLSMNHRVLDKAEAARKKLEEVRELFK